MWRTRRLSGRGIPAYRLQRISACACVMGFLRSCFAGAGQKRNTYACVLCMTWRKVGEGNKRIKRRRKLRSGDATSVPRGTKERANFFFFLVLRFLLSCRDDAHVQVDNSVCVLCIYIIYMYIQI